jgi:hypothetical protein
MTVVTAEFRQEPVRSHFECHFPVSILNTNAMKAQDITIAGPH